MFLLPEDTLMWQENMTNPVFDHCSPPDGYNMDLETLLIMLFPHIFNFS